MLFEFVSPEYDCRFFGNKQLQKIKNMLLVRPTNVTKGCSDRSLHPKTINGYLSNYRTFFSWLMKNAFADVSVKQNELLYIKHRAFEPSEIKQLLSYLPSHGTEAKQFRNDAEWFVPIAFFTGMRLNEVSEIQLNDTIVVGHSPDTILHCLAELKEMDLFDVWFSNSCLVVFIIV
ncbi:MAG: integrase [Paraglaciecola sp.]|jgi:integrase